MLKPGAPRTALDSDFEMDGGLQLAKESIYVFSKCHYIKIRVEFSKTDASHQIDPLPTDKITKISQPHLELPVAD